MIPVVTRGPFTFYDKARLDTAREAVIDDDPSYTRDIAGATVNSQSFTFTHSGVEYSREEYVALLQDAYNQLGEYRYGTAPGNRTAANFNAGRVSGRF